MKKPYESLFCLGTFTDLHKVLFVMRDKSKLSQQRTDFLKYLFTQENQPKCELPTTK